MKRNIVILTVLFVFCITLPALAADTDRKIYPGIMGHKGQNHGGIFNYDPGYYGWMPLTLPVIRDNDEEGGWLTGWVKVEDRHYTADVSCQLCCIYHSGGSWYGSVSAIKSSSGSNNASQILYFGDQAVYPDAHIYYYVSVPPMYSERVSGVISYSVTEHDLITIPRIF